MPKEEASVEERKTQCPQCKAEVPALQFCDQCGAEMGAAPAGGTKVSTSVKLLAGKYSLDKRIGEGGMGVVYQGTDASIPKQVAIKKMREELRLDRKLKKQFLEEARMVAELHHQNIVDIYAVLEEGDDIYIVFELLEGRVLKEILDADGPLSLCRAKGVLAKIFSALKYAHGRKVIHRDLKPANIMLCADDHAKVLDFGIARRAHDTVLHMTNTRDSSGTLAYMPPEQEISGQANKTADIFAAGATFYEMLVGAAPFTGANPLAQKERMAYKKASECRDGLAAADEFIARCLQAKPDDRYQSADEALASLQKL